MGNVTDLIQLAAVGHHGKARAVIHVSFSTEFSGPNKTHRVAKAWNIMKI